MTPTPSPSTSPEGQTLDMVVTYYGWPDNDPAGRAIAYPVIHKEAGGTGTYDDPITFASDNTFAKGQILYVPYIQKYVIREDLCASCKGNWIDIWMESDSNFKSQVISCEEHWTKWKGDETSVEVNPPSDRPVDTTPLFNKDTGVCRT